MKRGREGPASSVASWTARGRRRRGMLASLNGLRRKPSCPPLPPHPPPPPPRLRPHPAAMSPGPAHNAIQSMRGSMRHPQSHFPSCSCSSLSPYPHPWSTAPVSLSSYKAEDASSLPTRQALTGPASSAPHATRGRPRATPTPTPSSCSSLNL